MKKCLLLANCFVQEYQRHLQQSKKFTSEYEIITFRTYQKTPDNQFDVALKSADLIITQNVKNIPEYTNEYIKKHKNNNSIHIVTEFWRFNGFWPYTSINQRKNSWFWFPTDEFGGDMTFHQYMNHEVDEKKIKDNFEKEVNKLSRIDSNSDIKIFDIFMNNYKKERLFTDHWHPLPFIISSVTNEILKIIGINEVISSLPSTGMNSNRYRLITNHVKQILGLKWESGDNNLIFLDKLISTVTYYDFTRYLQSGNLYINLTGMGSLKKEFDFFLNKRS